MRELTDDWEFIVLACDGIWDVMTNQVRFLCDQNLFQFLLLPLRQNKGQSSISLCGKLVYQRDSHVVWYAKKVKGTGPYSVHDLNICSSS